MSTEIILVIAVIAVLIWAIVATSRNSSKKKVIRDLNHSIDRVTNSLSIAVRNKTECEENYKKSQQDCKVQKNLLNSRTKELQKTRQKLDKAINDLVAMDDKFKNIEKDLANNIVVLTEDGTEINYYRVKEMDENDDFKGYKIGDKVPHIRRKVNKKYKNVPVKLTLKRK